MSIQGQAIGKVREIMLVEFSIGIGRHYEREVIEFGDNTTDEELQQHFDDWTMNHLDGSICKID